MIKAKFTDNIAEINGRIVRNVIATWPATRSHGRGSVSVFREFEDGKKQVRKLCYVPISGYMIDDREPSTWCNPVLECRALSRGDNVYGSYLTDSEVETIINVHPDFRYTLKKAGNVNCAKAMLLLQQWLKDRKVELLVGAKYEKLACNKNFIRYGKEKQKKILGFVRSHEGSENWPLQLIKFVMDGGSIEDYNRWMSFRDDSGKFFPYTSYRYLSGLKDCDKLKSIYRDYIAMAKECGHNVKDKYWYAPKNLKKAHDKVMKEVELVREAKRKLMVEKARQEEEKKKIVFHRFGMKFNDLVVKQGCLMAYVPDDTDNVDKHAKALHQCLVTADYIGKMAKQKIVLVFIVGKNGKPVATAEILPGVKIGQFYGNELHHDFSKMKPGPDAVKLLDKWLEKFRESNIKFKPKREVA